MLLHVTDLSFSILLPANRGSSRCLNYLLFGKALHNCGEMGTGGLAGVLQRHSSSGWQQKPRGSAWYGERSQVAWRGWQEQRLRRPQIPKDEQEKEEELARGTVLPAANVAELKHPYAGVKSSHSGCWSSRCSIFLKYWMHCSSFHTKSLQSADSSRVQA